MCKVFSISGNRYGTSDSMSPKFQVYKDASEKARFRLRADNGRIVAVGEAYEQYASCTNGVRSVQRNSGAGIEDLTVENGPRLVNPKYQVIKDAAGEFRFRLRASNGEIIASGEGYESKASCLNGIEVVKASADAEIEDTYYAQPSEVAEVQSPIAEPEVSPKTTPVTKPVIAKAAETIEQGRPPKFQVYKDAAGKTRFRLRAANGQIVATSEAYEQYAGCMNGVRSVQKNCRAGIEDLTVEGGPKLTNPKYQIYKDTRGEFRFRLRAPNGEIIAQGEGYESKEGCLNGIGVVSRSAEAQIQDDTKKPPVEEAAKSQVVVPESPPTPAAPVAPIPEPEPMVAVVEEKPEVAVPKPEPIVAAVVEKPEVVVSKPEPQVAVAKPEPVMPTVPVQVPPIIESYPLETLLELYPALGNIPKGTTTFFKGRLVGGQSKRGIGGAKIRIYERDKSLLGDDYLAFGNTMEDGSFNIPWKVRQLTWRKETGNIYAMFAGNEKAKPCTSAVQTIVVK